MNKNEKSGMVKLLKNRVVKDGKSYINLYLQVSEDGRPIEIKLAYFNIKVKNLLLAHAVPCEINQFVKVQELPVSDENGVVADVEEN